MSRAMRRDDHLAAAQCGDRPPTGCGEPAAARRHDRPAAAQCGDRPPTGCGEPAAARRHDRPAAAQCGDRPPTRRGERVAAPRRVSAEVSVCSSFDLIVRGGHVVTAAGVVDADVGVIDGAIVAVEPELGGGAREVDASGLHAFPGGLDPHVHFNEPGRAHWEGLASGSAALAAGGFTAFFDMPLNSTPPTIDAAGFDAKLAAARVKSCVDFGLWGGLVPGNVDRLEELAERGVIGFKAFMSNSGIEEFPARGRRDALRRHGRGGAARVAGRGACRERRADRARDRPDGA